MLKRLSELRFERPFQQLLLADAVLLSERQLPEVHAAHLAALRALDIPSRPELYLGHLEGMNARTVGSARPVVILSSGVVSRLDPGPLSAVLGHEAGHILSDHVHYATVLAILQQLLRTGLAPIARLPLQAVTPRPARVVPLRRALLRSRPRPSSSRTRRSPAGCS